MRERQLLLAGLVVVCAVSAVALARLIAVLRIFRRRQQRSISLSYYSLRTGAHTRGGESLNGESGGAAAGGGSGDDGDSRFLLPSLLFHILVFLCLVIEVPVYAVRYASTLHSSGVGRPLFAVHLCGYLLLFCAFCVIVTLWSDLAVFEPNEWTTLVNRSMLVLCLCYLIVTIVAVSVCLGVGNVKFFFSSVAFLLFCAYSITALLLLGSCFLVLGCLLQRRICRVLVTDSCTPRLTARVLRINVVMLACFICFTLRALMLAALVQVQAEGEEDRQPGLGWKKWEWDMRLEWAPHVIPCVAMLYLMRNAAGSPSRDTGEGEESTEFFRVGPGEEGGDFANDSRDGKEPSRISYGSHGAGVA